VNRDLPGNPDLANRASRWAVFVHGCFWHRHSGCPRSTTPKNNRAFWVAKFDANIERDKRVRQQLRDVGFRVFVTWECEAEDARVLQRKVARFLARQRSREDVTK
jgi:DNA mismatch endonuclease (patch repair protein)